MHGTKGAAQNILLGERLDALLVVVFKPLSTSQNARAPLSRQNL